MLQLQSQYSTTTTQKQQQSVLSVCQSASLSASVLFGLLSNWCLFVRILNILSGHQIDARWHQRLP